MDPYWILVGVTAVVGVVAWGLDWYVTRAERRAQAQVREFLQRQRDARRAIRPSRSASPKDAA